MAWIDNQQIAELSEAQVLAQLRLRKVKLKMELERVEIAIRAFEEVEDIDRLDALPYMLDDIKLSGMDEDEELAVATLMYNSKMTAEKKILYVLGKLKNADANEIADYILKIDRKIKDGGKLRERIVYVSSKMFRSGKIGAIKDGKRNVYRLTS